MKGILLNIVNIRYLIALIFISNACVPAKNLRYFNDINQNSEPIVNPKEQKVILPFDNLYIKILSVDEKTSQIFNNTDESRGNGPVSMYSYSVDENGNINFPFVGNINVVNLTVDEAGGRIKKALDDYISNTAVIVKFIDNKISIIGEVQNQGVHTFSQDKLNIYEALALGGGITRFGDHKKVILVRQEGDKIMHYQLDLTNSRIAEKSYYYIFPNDVIIVEPMKSASWAYNNNSTFGTILSSITTFLAIYAVLIAPKL